MGCPVEGRECYLCVGLNKDMTFHVCRTFQDDLVGLVEYLGRYADRFPETNLSQEVNELLDTQIQQYWKNEQGRQERQQLFDGNLSLIESRCHPATAAAVQMLSDYLSLPKVLLINGVVLESIAGKWKVYGPGYLAAYRDLPRWQLDNKKTRVGIYCPDAAVLWACLAGHQVESQVFYKPGRFVYIDFRVLNAALSAFSFAPLFQSDFIFDFMDTRNLRASWQRLFYATSNMVPTQVILLDDRQDIVEEVIKITAETTAHIKAELQLTRREIDQYYSDYTGSRNNKRARRILFLSTRFSTYIQHSIRDLAWGFEKIGCATVILKENHWEGVDLRQDYIQNTIASFLPDMVFTIDHLRYEFDFYVQEALPFVSWIQDPLPRQFDNNQPPLRKNDFVFAYAPGMKAMLQQKSRVMEHHPIRVLPVTANPDVFFPIEHCSKKYDVTYISHLVSPESTLFPVLNGWLPPGISSKTEQSFLIRLVNVLDELTWNEVKELTVDISITWNLVDRICREFSLECSQALRDFIDWRNPLKKSAEFMWHVLTLMKLKPVKFLLDHGVSLALFGNNWEKYYDFEKVAKGPVVNGSSLNRVMNESKITLSFNPSVTYHMRAPETIAAACFMISGRVKEDTISLCDFFVEGEEVVLVDDEFDLLEKVHYFLKNEKEREFAAQKAYNRFRAKYTAEASCRKVLDCIYGTY
ncbi:MAG: glycosyltransferase [Proteobacteria bacterium]|nr:glycosyltransferase [Pseudomonadota bacterium]MBU4296658.1 glycosyltransferase [Pseudomonadota bacterium]